MPDKKFQIDIATSFDPSGAKKASDGLKDMGETGKKSTEGLFDKSTELRHLLHGMGEDTVPGLGRALSMLAMGPLGAVVALTSVVEYLKHGVEETNKKLDELSANAAKAFGGGDWATNYVTAVLQAAEATDTLTEALRKAKDAGPEIKTRYDAETKAIQASVTALQEKLKAQEALDVAEARKRGASPEEVNAIQAHYESRDKAVQDAADQALQLQRQKELKERTDRQAALETEAESKKAPLEATIARTGRLSELTAQEAALAQATAEMHTANNDDLKEQVERNKELLADSRKRYGTRDPLGFQKQMQEETDRLESETAEARATAAKEKIMELGRQIAADKENADKEKSARDEANNATTENARRVVELQKEIADGNQTAQIKTESIAQLLRSVASGGNPKTFERAAGVDTDAGAASLIEQFLGSQNRLLSHHGTQGDSQMVQLVNQLLQSTRQADQRTFLLLQDLIKHKGDLTAALADLARQTNSRMARVSTTGQ